METDDWRNPSKGSPLCVCLALLLITGSALQRAFDSMAPKLSTTIGGVEYFLTPKAEDNTSSLQAGAGAKGGGGSKSAAGKTSKGAAKGAKDGKGGKYPKKSGAKSPETKNAGKGKQRLHFDNADSFLVPTDGAESAQWAGSPRRYPTLGGPMRASIREAWAKHAMPGGSARRKEPSAEGGGS